MATKVQTLQVINKRIAQNIVELADADRGGTPSLLLDDCLLAAWEALIFLDISILRPDEFKLRHVQSILPLLKRKKTKQKRKIIGVHFRCTIGGGIDTIHQ